ncbi:Mitochondrial glycoprotein family protein [Corchorus capsularis]|uniref:Mitochondrial glycoprotein family protein n=1 Tax=Corchorus capsularis TaxID=210143 RepID=A0A1R3GM01_COCAP|nr:Mitochondrial glycoprotein family protein [Corchorus capsularis]
MEDYDGNIRDQYNGERIKINIDMKNVKDEDSSIPFAVSITKRDDGHCLESECTSMADKIEIHDLTVKDYEHAEFNLSEKLKEGFLKYLEMRGIKASTSNSLHKNMMSYKSNGDEVFYVRWLKTLKKFVNGK